MMILEQKRRNWMNAVREHSDAVAQSRVTGKPIPHLMDLLANLKAARSAYFEEYLASSRHENEEWRKRFIIFTSSNHAESGEATPKNVA